MSMPLRGASWGRVGGGGEQGSGGNRRTSESWEGDVSGKPGNLGNLPYLSEPSHGSSLSVFLEGSS